MTDWKNIRGAGSYRQINATHCELRYRKDGKQLIRRIPCTVEEARIFLSQNYIGEKKRGAGMVGGTLSQACEAYKERQAARGKSEDYIHAVLVEVQCLMDYHTSLQDVTAESIEKFLLTRKCSSATRNKKRAMLRSFFHFCCRKRFVAANPVDGVESFDVVKKEPRRLTPEEFKKVWLLAEWPMRDALTWLLYTGCRVSEMCNATWDQFDKPFWSRWTLADRKRNINLTLPLNTELKAIVESRSDKSWKPSENSWEYSKYPITHLSKKTILARIKALCEAAGVAEFRTHDLRHAAASWSVEAGCTTNHAKELLGHTSLRTTELYTHPNGLDMAVKAQNAIAARLKEVQ